MIRFWRSIIIVIFVRREQIWRWTYSLRQVMSFIISLLRECTHVSKRRFWRKLRGCGIVAGFHFVLQFVVDGLDSDSRVFHWSIYQKRISNTLLWETSLGCSRIWDAVGRFFLNWKHPLMIWSASTLPSTGLYLSFAILFPISNSLFFSFFTSSVKNGCSSMINS